MTAQQVEDLVHMGFAAKKKFFTVEEVRENHVRTRLLYRDSMLRPGGTLSGPALFTATDLAMYALVLSHIGPELMAVTANLNMNFLARPKAGDIVAEGTLLKLGRRLAVMEVSLYSSAEPETLVAHVTYTLPFAFLVVFTRLHRFDRSLEEAAIDLGADPLTTFRRVTLPLILPGLVAAAIFCFTLSFDEFIRTLFVIGNENTLPSLDHSGLMLRTRQRSFQTTLPFTAGS